MILRARTEHPDFPDSISVVGITDHDRADGPGAGAPPAGEAPLRMHYFASLGVFRVYEVSVDGEAWRCRRDAPGFSQRFTGTFADGGATIVGRWQVCPDDVRWDDDLEITYRRRR